jgi:sugar (pentulose or hexulose) kinase
MSPFLAIDVGTTAVKAGLFTAEGACLASAGYDYTLQTPRVDYIELDAEVYWQATCDVVQRVLQTTRPQMGSAVQAIAVSSQGETTIAVDADGRPLHPALVWLDNRATRQAQQLEQILGAQVYARTGIPDVNASWTACKIAWLRDNQPEVFHAAHKFLLVQDFIVQRLTGRFVTDGAISCTTLLYDILEHRWWPLALDAVGLDAQRLADIERPGGVAGRLTTKAAQELGLSPGVPVVLGGMDQSAGAVGAGTLNEKVISETTGGALAIQAAVSRPDVDPSGRIPVYVHSAPGQYLFVPTSDTGGMAFKWFRNVFGEAEIQRASASQEDAYDLLTAQAAAVEAGSEGLIMLPHLTGAYSPEYNPFARGVFYGFTLYHQKGHFVRAVLEAIAYMLRRNLELIAGAGVHPVEVRSTGGGALSPLWRQIKADVLNLPVVSLQESNTALLGNAMLGALAVGTFDSLEQAASSMVRVADRLEPQPVNVPVYEQAYQRYCQLNDNLDPLFRQHFSVGES